MAVTSDTLLTLVTEGILRARYRRGLEQTELLAPGVAEQMTITLYPTSIVFAASHRIRLDISSSNFPRFDRNLNTGHQPGIDADMQVAGQTVYHDSLRPSHITLPVIPR